MKKLSYNWPKKWNNGLELQLTFILNGIKRSVMVLEAKNDLNQNYLM